MASQHRRNMNRPALQRSEAKQNYYTSLPAINNSPSDSSQSSVIGDGDDNDDDLTESEWPKESPVVHPQANSVSDALLLSPTQTRVVLWAVPRSISTAFFRAIMEGARIKVLLEPFSNAYYFGKERLSQRYIDKPPTADCSFADIKRLYEQPYSRYKSVFSKDMAYYLTNPADQAGTFARLLPRGYVHTFLIRHPHQSVRSLYKLSIDKHRTGWDWFNSAEAGYKELYELFMYVTQQLGQQAIVVEANDLIRKPRSVLIRYCSLTGLEFSEKMLSWKSIDYSLIAPEESSEAKVSPVEITGVCNDRGELDDAKDSSSSQPQNLTNAAEKQMSTAPEIFRGWGPWFEGVLSSTSFREFSLPAPSNNSSSAASQPKLPEVPAITNTSAITLPPKVVQCIRECMPYYEHMRKFKI